MKMSKKPVLALFLGPSSVPIHDDGYVLGQAVFIDQHSE
jgi:hypothetical protein